MKGLADLTDTVWVFVILQEFLESRPFRRLDLDGSIMSGMRAWASLPPGRAARGIPKTLEVVARSGCLARHLEYDQYPELHLVLVVQKTSV